MKVCIPVRVTEPDGDATWSCPACKDEGIPARILSIGDDNVAAVRMNGGTSEVALDLLDGLQPGDFILVHLSTAIAKLDPRDVVEERQAS